MKAGGTAVDKLFIIRAYRRLDEQSRSLDNPRPSLTLIGQVRD